MEPRKNIKEFVDKCHTDFWYYPKRAFCLMLWVFTIMAVFDSFAMNASAETGSITVSNTTNANWTRGEVYSNSAKIQLDNLENFTFDTGNFTSFINYTIFDPYGELTYSQPNEVTTFQITTNGSGHGVASYSRFLNRLTWVCGGDCVITDQTFKVTYSQNIFANVTATGAGNGWLFVAALTGAPPPANNTNNTMPMYVYNGSQAGANFANRSLLGYDKAPNTRKLIFSGIFTSGTVTNTYNITYPAQGFYLASINKSGQTIKTQDFLHTQTNNSQGYYAEAALNNNSFQVLMPQLDGIYLNVTMGTGDFNNVLINASGSTLQPTPVPNASDPNNPNCVVNCIITSKPTYNNTESVNVYGSFYPANTTVTDCLFFGFICEDVTINKESTTGYVFISTQGSTSPIKFIPFLTDQNDNYNLYTDLDIGTYQAQLYGFAAPGTLCSNGIVYDFPFIPLGCYYPHNITNFNVVNASGNLSIVWQTKLSNSTAIYGDTITVAWSNVTANDTVRIYDEDHVLLQSYNINQSTVSQIPVFIPLYHIGQFNATIFNGSDILHNATAYLNVVPPGSVDLNNSFGITMYWSKAADVINNPTTLNWNTGTYTGFYNISVLKDGTEVRRNAYTGAPGQVQTSAYTFSQTGPYVAQFLDVNNTVQQQATILISTGTAGTTPSVTPPPSGAESAQDMGNNLIGFMSMAAFWGLIILILVMWIAATKAPESLGIVTFIVANVEAVIGLWAPFTWYVLVITWIIAGIYFTVSRHTVTGVK